MSSVAPSPVRSRRSSAARIDEKAYMPAAMSATGIPAFDGESGVPVTDSRPGLALHQQVVGLLRRVRTGGPVARDAAPDQPRMLRAQFGRTEPQALRRAGREVLQEHIGLLRAAAPAPPSLRDASRRASRLSFERLIHTKCDDSPLTVWSYSRAASPPPGRSILITRAPSSASWRVANGPAMTCSSATTVMPSSGLTGT